MPVFLEETYDALKELFKTGGLTMSAEPPVEPAEAPDETPDEPETPAQETE